MKKILFLLILISQISYGEQKILTIASINKSIITNIDIINEIKIIKILSNVDNQDNINNLALNNLIEEFIKNEEIKKNKIQISNDIIQNRLNLILESLEKQGVILNILSKNKIFQKIKINYEWNELILKKYINQININLKEIETKMKESESINKNEKNKLIDIEKNKKLNIYSILHYEKLKQNALIKIY